MLEAPACFAISFGLGIVTDKVFFYQRLSFALSTTMSSEMHQWHWPVPSFTDNKTPKVVSVGCVGLWKHNGILSEFGKIRETGKMCHVMSIDE